MSALIETNEEFAELIKSYNPFTDDELFIQFNKPGEKGGLVIYPGDYINYDKQYIQYMGNFTGQYEIDKSISCLFKIAGKVYYNKAQKIQKNLGDIDSIKKKVHDDSRLLNTNINPEDNELLVIIKLLLKGMTLNSFKSLFPKDDVSSMNNARREIEKTDGNGQLSWKRFTELLGLLNVDYSLKVKVTENEIIGSDFRDGDNITN